MDFGWLVTREHRFYPKLVGAATVKLVIRTVDFQLQEGRFPISRKLIKKFILLIAVIVISLDMRTLLRARFSPINPF